MKIKANEKITLARTSGMPEKSGEKSGRTLEIVAAEIRAFTAGMLNNIIEIGRRMVEAKDMLPHGQFGTWIQENTGYSVSTAENFMRLFLEYGDMQGNLFGAEVKSQTFGSLTYSKALALLAVPADERETFIKQNNPETLSVRELKDAIRERDEAKKELEKSRQALKESETKLAAERKSFGELSNKTAELRNELKQAKQAHSDAENMRQKTAAENLRIAAETEKAKADAANAEASRRKMESDMTMLKQELQELREHPVIEAVVQTDETTLENARQEVRDELQSEIDRLSEQIKTLQEQKNDSNQSRLGVFRECFRKTQENINQTKDDIQRMRAMLEEIRADDADTAAQLTKALSALETAVKEMFEF